MVQRQFAISLVLALTTPALAAAATAKPPKLEAAYVILGPQGPVARAVYKHTTECPSLTVNNSSQPMSVRALPEQPKKTKKGKTKDPAFPVLVCELLLPGGTTSAALAGQALPLPPATLTSVAVIGDTGCRLKAGNPKPGDKDQDTGAFQDCNAQSEWPFSELSASVAAQKPQVLVHVGDYIYREAKCPKGDKGCKGSPYGDNWDTWEADFFKPAASLLAAAPWIATRGNHETCARNGDGFMLFLDPTLATNQQVPDCNSLISQFTVTVGSQQFIVLDSSNAADACPKSGCDMKKSDAPDCPKKGCSAKAYADQFAAMQPANGAWLVSHRPVWGFKSKGAPLNATLQAALAQWQGKLPPGITLAVAGHIHIWEALSFADQRSPQFILGNGGTLLAHKIENPLAGAKIGGTTVAYGNSVHKWGFTIFTPNPGTPNWTATTHSVKGSDKLTCSVTPGTVSCE